MAAAIPLDPVAVPPADAGTLPPEDAAYLRSFERELADIQAGRHPLQQPG